MFAVGLSQGPPHHYWYLWLDKILPKTDLRTVALKIVMDQIFAAPFFAITFFFGMGVLEDKRMSECWTEFVKKFPTVYLVRNVFTTFLKSDADKIRPSRMCPDAFSMFLVNSYVDN